MHTIKKYLSQIGDFPYNSADRTWDGQTLFIKGAKSKYINHKNIPVCDVSARVASLSVLAAITDACVVCVVSTPLAVVLPECKACDRGRRALGPSREATRIC